jgi:hypothetical protein
MEGVTMAIPVTGQLYFFGQGDPTDARFSYVNNDGTDQTVVADNSPSTDLETSFPEEVGVDTAAGLYFAIVNGGPDGSGARLVSGSLGGGPVTTLFDYQNGAGSDDDTIVNALQVDVINHKIYVGLQDPSGGSPGNTGIEQYSYNPLTGAVTDDGFLVTVTSSGKPEESGFDVLDVRDFDLDPNTHTMFFTELLTGGVNANGLFKLDVNSPNTITQLVPQAQFPDDGSLGYITDVEVDNTRGIVYFDTESQHPYPDASYTAHTAENAIYYISESANGSTNATLLTLTGLPVGNHFYPGDMVFDQGTHQLYVESEETDDGSGADTDDVIYVFQLSADGHSASLASTITLNPAFTNTAANIGGMIFNDIPALTGISGTTTHAGEQGAAITLLTASPTITDLDGDHLASATVQITGGTFSSNESSANDDHLSVLAAALTGTNITATYNSATETLTLSGYDTLAHYQQVLAGVQFTSTGDNPTDYGLDDTRTITWTVSDGAVGIPSGSQNSATTVITIDAVNDAPVNTVPVGPSVNEDSTLAITGVSIADVDANPASAAMTVTLSVEHGILTLRTDVASGLTAGDLSGNGSDTVTLSGTTSAINATLAALNGLTYNNTADYNGSDTLQIVTNDNGNLGSGGAHSDTDSFSITINAVVDIADDSPSTNEDTAVDVHVLGNDTFEGTPAITAFDQGAHGAVTLNDNGTAGDTTDDYLVYTPTADYNGTDSFTYTVTSGGVTETATANVTISAVADIVDDSVNATEDTAATLDLLGNDSFENADASIISVGPASHGLATIDDNGTVGDTTDDFVVYSPDPDYNGSDSFTYTVTSGGVTETATVNVTVAAVADIADDNVTVNEDSGSTTLDLLGNDSFEDSGAVITGVTAASHGTVVLNDNGTVGFPLDDFVTYTPDPDYNGTDSFTYTVTSDGTTETATVNVTVNSVNDAPTSTNLAGDSVTWTEGDAAVLLDVGGDATVADIDSADFAGGTLSVGVTAGGASAEDVLAIHDEGTGAGQIGVSGANVTYGGTTIGTFTGGSAGADLVVTFNANADTAATEALLHNIEYSNSGGDNPTDGDRTVTWTLVDGDGTANGGVDTLTLTTTVNVDPVDDAPVAQPDAVSTAADTIGTGNVFLDNGSGADSDPDSALQVSEVNGVPGDVGNPVTLASGALVTLDANGDFSYDPNGQFDYLVSAATAAATGAVNTTASDSFDYTLSGGNTVTVTETISGVDGTGDQLWGDGTDNTMTGTIGNDFFRLSQGGEDSVTGGGGNDAFYMGGAFSAGDQLDGGAGASDQVGLQGDYSAGLTLGASSLVNIESLVFLPGSDTRFGDTAGNLYSYDITTDDANVASGHRLTVSWNTLQAGENVTFDGSAETNGHFLTYGGMGNDTITGGQQNDGFYFGFGDWGSGDSVDGQGGTMDQLGLQGNYVAAGTGAIVFGASQLSNIEVIVCMPGHDGRFGVPADGGYSYDLTMNDGNVASGQTLYVDASGLLAAGGSLAADETLTFDGSAETDGAFVVHGGAGTDAIVGGAGADQLWGGAGDDTITGGVGADMLHGDAGNDLFVYTALDQSTSLGEDQILDFASSDRIDLSAIDAISGGGDDAFTFIGSADFSNTAGELRAVEQTPDHWEIQGDVNGDGAVDLIIAVTVSDSHVLASGDFIL